MKNKYKLGKNLLFVCFAVFFSFSVLGQITLTATGGSATGSFTTISDAFAAINAGTHQGSITISINGNTSEPNAPVALTGSGVGAALYTAVVIKPTVVATVSGTPSVANGVINLRGADNVTIDGSITAGGTTRDLTIVNNNANNFANSAVIRLVGETTAGTGLALQNVTIINTIIVGNSTGNNGYSGSTVTTTYGIYAGSNSTTALSASATGANYDNLTIQNNEVRKAYYGIHVYANTGTSTADNVIIRGNSVGSSVIAESIGLKGINTYHVVSATIDQNTIFNLKATTSISPAAIEVGGSASADARISRNRIEGVYSESTGGWGAYGINLVGGNNHTVDNNVITDIRTVNYSQTSTTFNAFGIRITSGTGIKLYYNSVNLFGNLTLGTSAASSACLVVTSSTVSGLDVRNNIFNNTMTSSSSLAKEFVSVWMPTGYSFATTTFNRNYYGVPQDNIHFVGKFGTTAGANLFSDLAAWQAYTQVGNPTNDEVSFPINNTVAPFTTDLNLTIPAGTITDIESAGIAIASLGTPNIDFNGVARPLTPGIAPDMGAYEFAGFMITCPQPTGLTTVQATTSSATFSWTAGGSETSWALEYGPVGFTPGTGTTLVVTNPGQITGLTANTFYHVYLRGICAPGDTSAYTGPRLFNTYGLGQYMEADNACGQGFIDISTTGTSLVLNDEDETPITFPFSFVYQGLLITEGTLGNNGGIVLGTTTANVALTNTALATAQNGLYPMWDDLSSNGPGVWTETIGTAPNRIYIVQWHKERFGASGNPFLFQVQIHEATQEIYFAYEDVIAGNAIYDFGVSATVGVAGPNQDIQLSFNNANYLTNNECAHFYYTDCPKPVNLQFSNILQEEMTVTWAAGLSGETEWSLEYGEAGFTPGTGILITDITAPTQVLPNLTQITTYDVYVYAACATGDTSNALVGTMATLPNCADPTSVVITSGIDSLKVSWNWAQTVSTIANFQLEYGPTGFDLYTGTPYVGTATNNQDTIVNADLMAGMIYQVYVQAVCTNGDTSNFVGPFNVTMPITNDTVCYAEALLTDGTVYNFVGSGATVNNSSTPTESSIAPPITGFQTTTGWSNATITKSTWFTFEAPATGQVRISGKDFGFDGQMAVYEVGNCNDFATFELIAANDDEIGGTSLAPNFTVCGLTPGATYYLLHDPKSTSTTLSFNYSIKITAIELEAGNAEALLNICSGDTIDLFNTINGNDLGGAWIPTNTNVALVQDSLFSSNGLAYQIFNFQYRVTDGCAYDSIVSQVRIFAPSTAGEDGGISVCRNEHFDLLEGLGGLVQAGGTWYDPANNALPNSQVIASNFPGQYNYDYIAGNGVCPDDTALVIVNVLATCDFWGMDELSAENVSVYPNPTDGLVTIEASGLEKFTYTVLDVNGRAVVQPTVNYTSAVDVDLTHLEAGVYLVNISNETSTKAFRISVK